MRRALIINADDFGLSTGVNRGIVEAHVYGVVTSATVMVRQPAAADAAALAHQLPRLGVGLHVDLGEWMFVDGEWRQLYSTVDISDAEAVAGEVDAQARLFESLFGRPPTHLDSHQHVHQSPPVSEAVAATAARLGVPVRAVDVSYLGDFYGQLSTGEPYHQAITVDALTSVIGALPQAPAELACHPGYNDDLDTMYRQEREIELRVLCDPRVRAAIADAGIKLITFADLS